jgi:methanogenic corrinoid protein MtbC1
MTNLKEISASVQESNLRKTEALVIRALKEKYPPADILREGLVSGIMEMEKRFQKNEILDSEVLIAERAMKAGLQILMPVLKKGQSTFLGTVITGTLEGDLRETEKDIISCLMQSLGLKVIDLGPSVPNIRFIDAAIEEKAQIIVCTTALTIFLPQMKSLVQVKRPGANPQG